MDHHIQLPASGLASHSEPGRHLKEQSAFASRPPCIGLGPLHLASNHTSHLPTPQGRRVGSGLCGRICSLPLRETPIFLSGNKTPGFIPTFPAFSLQPSYLLI